MLTGSAIGGRTARACEGCMLKRARWFCSSDDAFLCDACDASVHTANQLASRHERVRISTASRPAPIAASAPDWHQKVTRRARTPRNGFKSKKEVKETTSSFAVPEIGVDEECDNEDLLVFQVPVLDADCGFWNGGESPSVEELHNLLDFVSDDVQFSGRDEGLMGVADVDFMCGAELEMLDFKEKSGRVKMEEGDEIDAVLACQFDPELIDSENRGSLLDWDFGFECDENEMAVKEGEEDVKMKVEVEGSSGGGEEVGLGKRMLLLKLNCEEVVSAWDEHGCPWMNGTRPEFDPFGDNWPQFSGIEEPNPGYGAKEDDNGGRPDGGVRVVSEERLARVTRYREKRRSRLFSKKIRYQVRKLNAEKRPRMKGRFCKRVQSYVGPQVIV